MTTWIPILFKRLYSTLPFLLFWFPKCPRIGQSESYRLDLVFCCHVLIIFLSTSLLSKQDFAGSSYNFPSLKIWAFGVFIGIGLSLCSSALFGMEHTKNKHTKHTESYIHSLISLHMYTHIDGWIDRQTHVENNDFTLKPF